MCECEPNKNFQVSGHHDAKDERFSKNIKVRTL